MLLIITDIFIYTAAAAQDEVTTVAESSSSLSTGITTFPAPTPPLTYSVQGEIKGFSAMYELSQLQEVPSIP